MRAADPSALQDCSPAAARVFDALRKADRDLSSSEIEDATRHARSTVTTAINELRDTGIAERNAQFPVPKYSLAEEQPS